MNEQPVPNRHECETTADDSPQGSRSAVCHHGVGRSALTS
eukprot:CAMPEP_0114565214 /NCGR_PEP_ID=MMETSP0114-20121206/14181_1 /TAXON_ID=31324 /ORGANISM="Goniomonas sp, Strain m" /LENGTH=39 /DNA_ID= /DNA_START= /DNA_END= /DNA_ORIENTATION=